MGLSNDQSPLLGGDSLTCWNKKQSGIKRNLSYLLNIITIGIIAYLCIFAKHSDNDDNTGPSLNPQKKKNIIMMVTDGMGPASLSAARSFRQFRDKLAINDILTLDKYLIGSLVQDLRAVWLQTRLLGPLHFLVL